MNSPVASDQTTPTEGNLVVLDFLKLALKDNTPCNSFLADLAHRSERGRQKYGTVLKTNNGRLWELDFYQELCDAVVYSFQGVLETESASEAGKIFLDTVLLIEMALRVRERLVEKGVLSE